MKEQALQLDPPLEIHFKGPYTEVTTSFLYITNPTNEAICFKIKTTAPKAYCVRPNGGILLPGEKTKIILMLQPLDPESDERNKDKFMVQSAFTPEITTWLDSVWQGIAPNAFMNSKLKCVFDFTTGIEPTAPFPDYVDHQKPKVAREEEAETTNNEDAEVKFKELTKENAKLKSELLTLGQENSSLKEEGLRSRMAFTSRPQSSVASEPPRRLQQPPKPQPIFTPLSVALAILMMALGFFIGKTLL